MKAHMTEKMLKKTHLNCRVFEGNLNTNKYDKDTLMEKVCSHCLIKSFKTTDVILIRETTRGNCSHCIYHLDSEDDFSTNTTGSSVISYS